MLFYEIYKKMKIWAKKNEKMNQEQAKDFKTFTVCNENAI